MGEGVLSFFLSFIVWFYCFVPDLSYIYTSV